MGIDFDQLIKLIGVLAATLGSVGLGLKAVLIWLRDQLEAKDKYQHSQLEAASIERKEITNRFLQSLDERAEHDRQADEQVAKRLEDVARLVADTSKRSADEHKALMDILSRRRESDVDRSI